jgi:hypothetical protein
MIKSKENAPLFVGPGRKHGIAVSLIHDDSADIPTIGYGFNLSPEAHKADQIRSALTHALGGALTPDQEQGMQILEAWNSGTSYYGTTFNNADIIALAKVQGLKNKQ